MIAMIFIVALFGTITQMSFDGNKQRTVERETKQKQWYSRHAVSGPAQQERP